MDIVGGLIGIGILILIGAFLAIFGRVDRSHK